MLEDIMSWFRSERGAACFALGLTLILMSACGVQGLSVHQVAPAQVLQVNPSPQPTPVVTTPQYDILISFLDSNGSPLIPQSVRFYLEVAGDSMSAGDTGILVHNRIYWPIYAMMSYVSFTFPKMESCPINLQLSFSKWAIDPSTNVATHALMMSVSAFSSIAGDFVKTDFTEDPLKSAPGPQILGSFVACAEPITAQFQRQAIPISGGQ
jgi:hypothetical protein